MKVSVNWIKQYLDFELPPMDELVQRIGAQLGAVEHVEYLGDKYQGIILAKVVSCRKHENSDHLNVCLIDDGGVVKDIARTDDGLVQVVCGAPNVREGLFVAWLPPGATVPETVGKEPFVLGARELRGELSNGMLASPKELALGDNHDGIMELNPHDAQPGADFAETYQLNDYIIEIENKMFTHRPDCFGELGIAREIAGILGQPFTTPRWYGQASPEVFEAATQSLPLIIKNEIPELVPRFTAITVANVNGSWPSPAWLQTYLVRTGIRPINLLVDITNYLMLLTGQPLHAYDYDKVKALDGADSATLIARQPRASETITLLNGKTIDPRQEAIMIATETTLVGVGGIMGGVETEVSSETRNIILECANFNMYSIRRTSMAHGLFTDAVSRFNKGQSPLQTEYVLQQALRLIRQFSDNEAYAASDVIDVNQVAERLWVHLPVPVGVEFINNRLGSKLTAADIKQLLENVECQVTADSDKLTVTAPFWRTDIETREDVVEEVGRLYGFDKLPLQLPRRSILPAPKDETLRVKQHIRGQLAKAGANEVLTYSFVHGDLLTKSGQDKAEAFQLSNALSPDLQYYRLSLTPNLLEKVHANVKAGYDHFALFEIGKVHGQSEMDDAGLPKELQRVVLVLAADAKQAAKSFAGAPYFQAQLYVRNLLTSFDTTPLRLEPLDASKFADHVLFQQLIAPFEPSRSALIFLGDKLAGVVGEYRASVRHSLKLPAFCAGFELFLSPFMTATKLPYTPLSRFPKITQDLTLKVAADVSFQTLYQTIGQAVSQSKYGIGTGAVTILPIDIYQSADSDHRQLTFRVIVTDNERTLTDAEVGALLDDLVAAAKQAVNAERI